MIGASVFRLVCHALGKPQKFYEVVAKCVYAYLDDYVIPRLLNGGVIYLPKLGILRVKKMKKRNGYDVSIRRHRVIPARRGIKFDASKELKDVINENTGYKSKVKGVTLDVIEDIAKRFELDNVIVKNIFRAWGNVAFMVLISKERLVLPHLGTLYIKNHATKQVMNVVKHQRMYMQERAVVNIEIKKNIKVQLN